MNILFLISSEGKGAGGHYNSLFQISFELAKTNQVKIVLIGNGSSPIVESSPYFLKHIKFKHSFTNLFRISKEINNLCKEFKPDIFHCFDVRAMNQLILSTLFKKHVPVILTKCGGRNPLGNNYQHANAIVVFSKENQDWFTKNSNYRGINVYLIPNRVRGLIRLPSEKQVEKAATNKISFVRITRIGNAYEHTLKQTLNLLDKLSSNIPVELFVIGKINSESYYAELVKEVSAKKYSVHFITDDRAFKASDFLYLADYAIGTGRSFMEATSLGIPTLTPAANTHIPVLVNNKNVENFLNTNFSERNVAPPQSDDFTLKTIIENYESQKKASALKNEAKQIFDAYFGTNGIASKYKNVYDGSHKVKTGNVKLFIKNFQYIAKYIITGS